MKTAMRDIAIRMNNAHVKFISDVQEQFGFTEQEAEKILRVFVKAKAMKLNVAMGRYDLKHGAFWDASVMRRALEQ